MQPSRPDSTIALDTAVAGQATADSVVRAIADVLQIGLTDTLRLAVETASGKPSEGLAPWLIPALMALVGALIGTGISAWWQKKSLEEKRREEERRDIYRKLNEFYGPVSVLLYESEMWHSLFKGKNEFRTLTDLIEGRRFTGDDKVLLDEIMRTTDRISMLIVDKGGLVEEEPSDLTELLSKARTHYRLLRLAAEQKLTEDASRYAEYVYPKALDGAIRARKAALEAQLKALNGTPPPTPTADANPAADEAKQEEAPAPKPPPARDEDVT